jgi:hypothetical protein
MCNMTVPFKYPSFIYSKSFLWIWPDGCGCDGKASKKVENGSGTA